MYISFLFLYDYNIRLLEKILELYRYFVIDNLDYLTFVSFYDFKIHFYMINIFVVN